MEISGYHNGAKRGCLQVPIEVKTGDWACEFFFGLGKESVVSLKIKTLNLNQVWKKLKVHEILSFEK